MSVFIPKQNLHSHTIHCGHAQDCATTENYLRFAGEENLDYFAITEHVIFPEDGERVDIIRQEAIEHQDLAGDCRILIGAEMDPDPNAADGSFVCEVDCDIIVLSPHRMPDCGLGHWEYKEAFPNNRDGDRERWLDWYEACVERGGFHILGHPLREPMMLGIIDLSQEQDYQRVKEIFIKALRKNIVFELNQGWCHGLISNGFYDDYLRLMKELKSLGMQFSLGPDAHALAHAATAPVTHQAVTDLGLTKNDWFDPSVLSTSIN